MSSALKFMNEKGFMRRFAITICGPLLIILLTIIIMGRVSSESEAHAYEDIKMIAVSADDRMSTLVDEIFSDLIAVSHIYDSKPVQVDTDEVAGDISAFRIGGFGMRVRIYFPDGRAFAEDGPVSDASDYIDYNFTLNQMKDGRYISCVKKDLIDSEKQVMEFIVPMKSGDNTIALMSAVLDLSQLPSYMNSSAFAGEVFLQFVDTRDGTMFLDTYHNKVSNIFEYSGRTDKDGNSLEGSFFSKIMRCEEAYTTLKSQSTGKTLYMYDVPSKTEGWVSGIIIDEDAAFSRSRAVNGMIYLLTALEAAICISVFFWIFISSKKQIREDRNSIFEKLTDEDAVFLVNMERDTRKTLHDNTAGANRYSDEEKMSENFASYIDNCVAEADREMMRKVNSYEYIRARLQDTNEFSVEYRDITTEIQRFFEMRIVKLSDTEYLQCFKENDKGIINRMIFNKLYDDFFAIIIVDLDSGLSQVIKSSSWYMSGEEGTVTPYTPTMRRFAELFSGETRDFFHTISDIKYLKRRFSQDDRATFTYKTPIAIPLEWVEVTELVLTRNEDGLPSAFALCFTMLDEDAVKVHELQAELKEDVQIIGGLASSYHTLYYLNIDEEIFDIYSYDEKIYPELKKFFEEKDPFKMFRDFGHSDLVYPDDRQLFDDIEKDIIREKLAHRKKFSIRFRRDYNGEYRWVEMDFIKYEALDVRANAIAIGFALRDSEIRSEQVMNNCFGVLGKDMPPQESIDYLLSTTGEYYGAQRSYIFEYDIHKGICTNTYEWCAEGIEPMIDQLQSVSLVELEGWNKEFNRRGAFLMDVLDTGHNTTEEGKAILEMQGIDSLIAAPIMNGDEIVGFIGVDNPTMAKDNISLLKNVAVIAYSEILQRKEKDEEHVTLGKLADAFVLVYFVDLSKDYMHTWKIDDEYKEAYGATEKYSVSMGGYVRNNIAEADRERCMEMTSPEYVLKQFETKESFSIDMTDIMLGYERNIVFDYIKVNESGTQFVACASDVTEMIEKEKMQQKLLEEARVAAEEASKSKSYFLFNMSHDIRTPMNAISGFTGMAKKNVDNPKKVIDYLDKIETSGNQLLELINQVLEMSRIEAGRIEIEEVPVDVIEEYKTLVTVLSEQAEEKELTFHHLIRDIKHNIIYADRTKMSSITINIVGNSLKYTPSGGTIDFELREVPCEREGYAKFVFTLSDTGIGMSPEYLKTLFDPFTREKNSTVSKIQGTGLGMSIVKDLVDIMGGTIDVQSEVGKGTTFTVAMEHRIDKEQKAESVSESAKDIASLSGLRVLVVEDNELNREIASDILQDSGMIVEEAEDGTVAVDMMKDKGPDYYDFILMDIQMPLMNGYDATRLIRQMYPDKHIPIIALSANAFAEDKAASIDAGMDVHVAKPINIEELMGVMGKFKQ